MDDEQACDRIEQDEIDEILAEPSQTIGINNANPTNRNAQQDEVQEPQDGVQQHEPVDNVVTNDEDDL